MRLYLASFLEPENFGPGRVIGIAAGNKPRHIDVSVVFKQLIPSVDLMDRYRKLNLRNKKEASEMFVREFSQQLSKFENDVKEKAKTKKIQPVDILPFKEGDTLASWERARFTNYRSLVGLVLERLGFDVVVN